HLEGVRGIKLTKEQKSVKCNYAYFPVLFDGYRKKRDEIFVALAEQQIFARKYFYPLTNTFECYKGKFDVNLTPVAKYIADRVLTLPVYADLALEDVDRVCNVILEK
ncbi:MAG: DegT/DnrJ/EryC1/StrS family aminotransferase, partial [Firmicutes bacterium]|nr:DegT/DnrJ/EryC1/StrS family aminotransferase [Bacillota bacterium]